MLLRKLFNFFVRKKLGIESVAFTQSSSDFVRKYWTTGSVLSKSDVFSASQSTPNTSLYKMLKKAIKKCLDELANKELGSYSENIIAHIHISAFLPHGAECEFLKIRRSMGIGLKKTSANSISSARMFRFICCS